MTTETPQRRRGGRIAAIASAGLLASILAVGATNIASAQSPEITVEPAAAPTMAVQSAVIDGDADLDAVWAEFDACLTEQGIAVETLDDDAIEFGGEEAALEAAFDACESLVEGLDEMHWEDIDEDDWDAAEAIFDEFDACLADAGIDIEAVEAADENGELTEADEAELDAAFDACDPILDGLPESVEFFEGCDDYDDHDHDNDDYDDEDDDYDDVDDEADDVEEADGGS